MERLRIAVAPSAELTRRERLLAALAEAYPVEFVAAGGDAAALVAFGPAPETTLPVLALVADEATTTAPVAQVALANDAALARPLRGAVLTDARLPAGAGTPAPDRDRDAPAGAATSGASAAADRQVLAAAGGRPVWTRAGSRQEAAAAPLELGADEALRDRLAPSRNAALLPLAHFLADLTADRRWLPGPSHAAIILDDPNLHWPTYGRVDYAALAAHAARHDYHASMAMVPLDAWIAHPGATRLFAVADRLSLCIHGNDHSGAELGRPRSDAEGVALASEALRRMERFERRTGVPVSRVMVPPHERVSEPAARALLACDYDAICTTRPYPWMVSELRAPWLTRPPEAGPLAGWHSIDVVAGGLPVLLRSGFQHPREDLALRAFLGQPLILYGHHDDLDDRLELLATAAAEVNRLGDVRWSSVGEMARACVETRIAGSTLHVRPRARRVRVEVPADIERLALDLSVLGLPEGSPVRATGACGEDGGMVAVHGPCTVVLEAGSATAVPAAPKTPPHRRLWPLARRWASEARDRAEPVRSRRAA